MIKTLNEQIAEYVESARANLQMSISIHEIQREFCVSYTQACDILDAMPNLLFNPYTRQYAINFGMGRS
jgi:hypothetical protein